MTTSEVNYMGDLRTSCVHLRSGNVILTDAPVDNNGKGEAFSPTDLMATSLATCMLTVMAITAGKNGVGFGEAKAEVTKIMAENPRRVAEIQIEIQIPKEDYSDQQKELLENAAINCPVAKSLSSEIKQDVRFLY